MNTPIPDDQLAAIHQALFTGKKIEAIKIYRGATGSDLLEAKNAIEGLDAALRSMSPEKFVAGRSRSGCLGAFAALTALLGVLVWKLT